MNNISPSYCLTFLFSISLSFPVSFWESASIKFSNLLINSSAVSILHFTSSIVFCISTTAFFTHISTVLFFFTFPYVSYCSCLSLSVLLYFKCLFWVFVPSVIKLIFFWWTLPSTLLFSFERAVRPSYPLILTCQLIFLLGYSLLCPGIYMGES